MNKIVWLEDSHLEEVVGGTASIVGIRNSEGAVTEEHAIEAILSTPAPDYLVPKKE